MKKMLSSPFLLKRKKGNIFAVSIDDKKEIFREYLHRVCRFDPHAVDRSIRLYKIFFSDCPDEATRDEMFWEFRKFYYSVLRKAQNNPTIKDYISFLNDAKVPSSSIRYNSENYKTIGKSYVEHVPMTGKIKKIFEANGFHIYQNEGRYYLNEQPDFLVRHFCDYITDASRLFLNKTSEEEKEGWINDMFLEISWQKLGERVVWWEKFIQENPDFIRCEKAERLFYLYLAVFMKGVGGSEIFSIEHPNPNVPRVLNSNVKKAYEQYIKDYSNKCLSACLIRNYYQILRKNNFEGAKEVMSFLDDTIEYDDKERRWRVDIRGGCFWPGSKQLKKKYRNSQLEEAGLYESGIPEWASGLFPRAECQEELWNDIQIDLQTGMPMFAVIQGASEEEFEEALEGVVSLEELQTEKSLRDKQEYVIEALLSIRDVIPSKRAQRIKEDAG
jgi:hypothetical protein